MCDIDEHFVILQISKNGIARQRMFSEIFENTYLESDIFCGEIRMPHSIISVLQLFPLIMHLYHILFSDRFVKFIEFNHRQRIYSLDSDATRGMSLPDLRPFQLPLASGRLMGLRKCVTCQLHWWILVNSLIPGRSRLLIDHRIFICCIIDLDLLRNTFMLHWYL